MECFFVSPEDIDGGQAWIRGEEWRHMARALRLKQGDSLVLLDGTGKRYRGLVQELGKAVARVRLLDFREDEGESALRLWLAQGLPKGDKMDFIVQKAAELGVWGVIPLEMERSVLRLYSQERRENRQERWQKVAREAVKQCGRSRIPQVFPPCPLETLGPRLEEGLCLVPWEKGGAPLKEWLREPGRIPGAQKDVLVIVGPEGGIEETEMAFLKKYECAPLSLGPRILRTETAGLAVLSVLQYEWGDMGGG
jgi:16S rRNA (uracil1498-N3)-methyltransferase